MFTGIIKAVAKVRKTAKRGGSLFLTIEKPRGWRIEPGDSIATDGVCLTVIKVNGKNYSSELMPETLHKTYFGEKIPIRVNLERPLRLSEGLGGHLVLGHADAVGRIEKITTRDRSRIYKIIFPSKFRKLVAEKGSIAVDGVSLTVVGVSSSWFTVSLVKYTLNHSTLGEKRLGEPVNLEFDVMAKYLSRLKT